MESTSNTTTTTVVPVKSNKNLVIAIIVAAVFLLLSICTALLLLSRPAQNTALSCQYNGATYENGSSFQSTDGCNTCSCGNGTVACTDMACNVGENPEPTPTPAPNPTQTEETLIGKLLVTDSDYFYGTTGYPEPIMTLKAADLLAITCNDQFVLGNGGTTWSNDSGTLSDSKVLNFLNSQPDKPVTVSYCVTAEGKYVLEYEYCTSQCGGGIGTIAYFGILENNALAKVTEIPNQLGAYYTCNKSLALTKNYEYYMRCAAGDGPSGAVAIYKVFLNEGNYTEIIKVDTSAQF